MPWKRMLAYISGSVNEDLLRRIKYPAHYHAERNHQGIENVIPFADNRLAEQEGPVVKAQRLGGLLNFYHRQAA